jgi:hypothetical protein
VLLHRLRERAEDDPLLLELGPEGGGDRDAVEDGVDRDAGEPLLLGQRDAQLLVCLQQLGIDLVQAGELLALLGRGVVDDLLIVDLRVVDRRPGGLSVCSAASARNRSSGLRAPGEQPRLVLLCEISRTMFSSSPGGTDSDSMCR